MADQFNSLEDFYKSVGVKDGVLPKAPNVYQSNTAPSGYGGEDVFESNIPESERLKKKDLYNFENLNIIRNYMTRNKGVDYKDADDDKLVEDYMDHMRWFNTNTVSTAGEVMFVTRGSEEDKKVAADAYQLYDRLGNVFVNDGFFGAVDGVKDYVFAAAADPTNYLGVLTGGVGKAAALGTTTAGKAAIKKAASNAATKAATSGATRAAASKAASEAAEEMARKMVNYGVTDKAMAKAAEAAAKAARSQVVLRAGQEAAEGVAKEQFRKAGRRALYATTALDGLVAGVQDMAIQDIYLDVGAQEEYSRTQTAFSTLLGGIGGGLHLLGSKATGVSGLGEAATEMKLAARAGKYKEAAPILSPEAQKAAAKVIKQEFDSWAAKVSRGTPRLGNAALPESMLKNIMLGEDGKGGLAKVMRDNGIKLRRDATVSDLMTNVIRYMPEEQLLEVSKSIHSATGIHLGDLDNLAVNIGDIMARDISRAGGTLSVMSQVRRAIDGGVVSGNEILSETLNNKAIRDSLDSEFAIVRNSKPFAYGQNVWKRLLVSSPSTTAANVMGFGQYYAGQTLADMLSSGLLGVAAVATGAGATKTSRELFRQARVYRQIQAQKMLNFVDPFTTKDAYMDLLEQNKDIKGLLFETVGAGVERSSKRYDINPDNPIFKTVENFTNAATEITGVRVQDTFTKSQMFMTELDKYLRLKKDKTLKEVLTSGDMRLIDDDVIGGAIDTTMRSVFSKDYTTKDQALGTVAKLVEQVSNTPVIGTVLPFGRFMNNVVATAYQWGPVAFLPAAHRIMKSSTRDMQALEAVSRSVVGSAALASAMYLSEEQEAKGLAYNEIDVGGGTIVDVQNIFPFSFMLAAGRYANRVRKSFSEGTTLLGVDIGGKGEISPTKEALEDFLSQMAIGQVARDTQFANDLYNVVDYFTAGKERGGAELDALYKSLGGMVAGVTRPLDAVNRAVGFMTETDYAKDPRQAETGGALFTQQATRYFDNIIEAFMGETETLTGEQLRVATREGPIYDANPLARIFGITVKRGRTAAEKAYSLAEMKTWTADSRSKIPHYDRIFNQTMAPILETKMNALLRDKRFQSGDLQYKRDRVRDVLNQTRKTVREALDVSTGETFLDRMRYKASTNGTKEQQEKAMKVLKERGVEAGLEDFNFRELQMYNSYIEYLKFIAKGN